MNAADVVKAIRIEPGTLVVFGDMQLDPDPELDRVRFTQLVESLRQVVGHDDWLALRIHEGAVVGSYSLEDVLAALSGTTTQEGDPDGQPNDPAHRDACHA